MIEPGPGARQLAELFHDRYEKLAPEFGWMTRMETRTFDPNSTNGRLMIAVCDEILTWLDLRVTADEVARLKGAMSAAIERLEPPRSRAMADSNLVVRLRARTITMPKPGTEPFVPTQPFWVTSDCGPHAAGEDAGLQYLPSFSTLGVSNAPTRVQAHVYVVEPLCAEAANALTEQAETIERLRAALGEAIDWLKDTDTEGTRVRLERWRKVLGVAEPKPIPTESAKATPGVMDLLELQAKTDAAGAGLNPLVKCPTCGMGYFKHPMQD